MQHHNVGREKALADCLSGDMRFVCHWTLHHVAVHWQRAHAHAPSASHLEGGGGAAVVFLLLQDDAALEVAVRLVDALRRQVRRPPQVLPQDRLETALVLGASSWLHTLARETTAVIVLLSALGADS